MEITCRLINRKKFLFQIVTTCKTYCKIQNHFVILLNLRVSFIISYNFVNKIQKTNVLSSFTKS